MTDILRQRGHLFLGSRMKRLGERLQADVLRFIEAAGLPIQPSQYPILAALDLTGPMTVGDMVAITGVSQPAVTRSLGRLVELGLVAISRAHKDQRHKTATLTDAGHAAIARSKQEIWPAIDGAVAAMCGELSGPLLTQLDRLEDMLAAMPLDRRASCGLRILPFTDARAQAFHDINAQWIQAMFRLEQTDREVLEHPRARIIDPGGDILFVEAHGLGIVGACALQKTGEAQFELTKMGVLEAARGRKAGEFLLRAVLRRAEELGAAKLYLLTNSACRSAIHLYEKLGFVHDANIMREFGTRYARCDVAMLYQRH